MLALSLSTLHSHRRPDKSSVTKEITQLKKRLQELDDLYPSLPSPSGSNSEEHDREPSSENGPSQNGRLDGRSKHPRLASSRSVSASLQDWIGPYSVDGASQEIDWPRSTRLVESDRKDQIAAANTAIEPWMVDVVHSHWANPVNFQARVELSRQAKSMMPSTVIIEELIDTFFHRCNYLVGNILYEPRFRRLSSVSYKSNLTTEEILTSPLYIDPCCWVVFFMVLSISLCFYPYHTANPTPAFHAVNSLRASEGSAWTERWHEFSRRCLSIGEVLEFTSLPAMQSAVLMLFRAKESDSWIHGLERIVISSAYRMHYHLLSKDSLPEHLRVEDRARKEVIARLWSHLCTRDWFAYARNTHHVIRTGQATTPMPLRIGDSEILGGHRQGKPTHDYSDTSYSLAMLSLSAITRDISEARLRTGPGKELGLEAKDRHIQSLTKWIDTLPPFYQPNPTASQPAIVLPQRWRLLSQAFHLMLKLYHGDVTRAAARQAMLPTAKALLAMYPTVTTMCPVIKAAWPNWIYLISACLAIGLDLIKSHRDAGGELNAHRDDARSLVASGSKALQHLSQSASIVARILLEVEEERYQMLLEHGLSGIDQTKLQDIETAIFRRAAAQMSPSYPHDTLNLLVPSQGHDATMPALATDTSGSRGCDIIRPELWRLLLTAQGGEAAQSAGDANDDERFSGVRSDLLEKVAAANSPGSARERTASSSSGFHEERAHYEGRPSVVPSPFQHHAEATTAMLPPPSSLVPHPKVRFDASATVNGIANHRDGALSTSTSNHSIRSGSTPSAFTSSYNASSQPRPHQQGHQRFGTHNVTAYRQHPSSITYHHPAPPHQLPPPSRPLASYADGLLPTRIQPSADHFVVNSNGTESGSSAVTSSVSYHPLPPGSIMRDAQSTLYHHHDM